MGIEVYGIADHYRICTSSTRPSGMDLYTGLMIYETDTQITRVWNGSDWRPVGMPAIYQNTINTAATQATSETVIGSLGVPAQPYETLQYVSASMIASASVAGDQWAFRVRQDNASGTQYGTARHAGSSVFTLCVPQGAPRVVPANTTTTYVATINRVSGSGTISALIGGNINNYNLSCLVLPSRTGL